MKNDLVIAGVALIAVLYYESTKKKSEIGSVNYDVLIDPKRKKSIDEKIKDSQRLLQLSKEWSRYHIDDISLDEYILKKSPDLYEKWLKIKMI